MDDDWIFIANLTQPDAAHFGMPRLEAAVRPFGQSVELSYRGRPLMRIRPLGSSEYPNRVSLTELIDLDYVTLPDTE